MLSLCASSVVLLCFRPGGGWLLRDGATQAGETPLELLNHLSGSWWMKERTQQQRHLVMAAAERRAAGGTGFLEMPLQGKEVESPLSSSSVPPLPPAQPQPPACPLAAAFASLRLAVGPAAGGPGACRLSDATLVCCGEDIAVHSLVLASQSAFFEALLLGQFQRRDACLPACSLLLPLCCIMPETSCVCLRARQQASSKNDGDGCRSIRSL